MKTVTKISWSKIAQDLYGRWFVQKYVQREIAGKKQTKKHKNGSPSPARSSYFLPNLRLTISKLFLKKCCQTCVRLGKHKILFCWEFLQPSSKSYWGLYFSKKRKKKKKKKGWELLDLKALTSSPSWMETSFAPAFPYKGWDCRESRHRGQCLMATSPAFPHRITCFKKIRLDQYFYRKSLFLWCRWEETGKFLELTGSNALCWGSEHTNEEIEIIHNTSIRVTPFYYVVCFYLKSRWNEKCLFIPFIPL